MSESNKTQDEILTERSEKKAEYGKLFDAVSEVLFRFDPAEINFGFNGDEYEPEAGTILPRLKNCRSAHDVLAVVQEEFQRWFDEETALKEENKELAEEIWNLWQAWKKKFECFYGNRKYSR